MNTDKRFGYVQEWIEIPADTGLVHVNDLLQTASSLRPFPQEWGRQLLPISRGNRTSWWLFPWLVHSTAPHVSWRKDQSPSLGAVRSPGVQQNRGANTFGLLGYDWLIGCFWLNWGDSRLSFFTLVNVRIWADQLRETCNTTHLHPSATFSFCSLLSEATFQEI